MGSCVPASPLSPVGSWLRHSRAFWSLSPSSPPAGTAPGSAHRCGRVDTAVSGGVGGAQSAPSRDCQEPGRCLSPGTQHRPEQAVLAPCGAHGGVALETVASASVGTQETLNYLKSDAHYVLTTVPGKSRCPLSLLTGGPWNWNGDPGALRGRWKALRGICASQVLASRESARPKLG